MDERLTTGPNVPTAQPKDVLPSEPDRCTMPDQVLWNRSMLRTRPARSVKLARFGLTTLWVSSTGAFALTLYQVLSVETPTILQIVFLVLSTICFAWVAIGSASAVIGFIWLLARGEGSLDLKGQFPQDKTALLFPVYREDPASVASTIASMARDIAGAQGANLFDIFILSDTQDRGERLQEQRTYDVLRARAQLPIYTRWRNPNTGKKAGNIREWVERYGAAYPYFIILDADSSMTADTLLRLVSAMECAPRTGLIQTVPRLVGGETLFARLQQFAAAYYGPILAAGLAAWHGPGSNYWGHNAIVRTKAFASCAGLPPLPGGPPLGGPIMSHDFVEAALLRRGGWEVHLVPSLAGSYEGCPPTLDDLIVRDRRWAQGNLQHMRVLTASGLPLLSRIHLAMGIITYLASPVWALSLLVGVVLAVQAKYASPTYFGNEVSLFPKWPVFDAQKALYLFLATILVVHLPKVLGAIWALRSGASRKKHGGAVRLITGVIIESIFATLIAPVLMLTQTAAVASILAGRDAGWAAQRRISTKATLADYVLRHRWHLAWGALGALVCWSISWAVLGWMSPIIAGLLLSPPLAQLVAGSSGRLTASLLANPEER